MPRRTDIRSILINGAGPLPLVFPAEAGTHLPTAPAPAPWIPACAGIPEILDHPRFDA
ncbi:MAG: hypothetical protein WA459_11505 [Stellaceae bacterium]